MFFLSWKIRLDIMRKSFDNIYVLKSQRQVEFLSPILTLYTVGITSISFTWRGRSIYQAVVDLTFGILWSTILFVEIRRSSDDKEDSKSSFTRFHSRTEKKKKKNHFIHHNQQFQVERVQRIGSIYCYNILKAQQINKLKTIFILRK